MLCICHLCLQIQHCSFLLLLERKTNWKQWEKPQSPVWSSGICVDGAGAAAGDSVISHHQFERDGPSAGPGAVWVGVICGLCVGAKGWPWFSVLCSVRSQASPKSDRKTEVFKPWIELPQSFPGSLGSILNAILAVRSEDGGRFKCVFLKTGGQQHPRAENTFTQEHLWFSDSLEQGTGFKVKSWV